MHIQRICGRSAAPGNSLYSTTRGIRLDDDDDDDTRDGRKLAKGAYSLESRARQVRKASLSPRVPAYLTPPGRAPVRLNAGTGMRDKSVLDAYFRERLPV